MLILYDLFLTFYQDQNAFQLPAWEQPRSERSYPNFSPLLNALMTMIRSGPINWSELLPFMQAIALLLGITMKKLALCEERWVSAKWWNMLDLYWQKRYQIAIRKEIGLCIHQFDFHWHWSGEEHAAVRRMTKTFKHSELNIAKVYPYLSELCNRLGYNFGTVDMRFVHFFVFRELIRHKVGSPRGIIRQPSHFGVMHARTLSLLEQFGWSCFRFCINKDSREGDLWYHLDIGR